METDSAPNQPAARTSLDAKWLLRLAFALAILALYQLGRLIPAAGINPDFSFSADPTSSALSYDLSPTLSNFALGVTPLFSLLLLAEVFKLAFSDVRGWANESRRTRTLFNKVLIVTALALAAFQAYGLSAGLEALQSSYRGREDLPILEPGPEFRMTYIAGIVAGTALSIWFADQITRHGVGSGFWILFLLPSLGTLAASPTALLGHLATGDISGTALVALVAVLVVSSAAVALLTRQWASLAPAARADFDYASDMARIVLWPPFIAASAVGLIAAFMNFFVSVDVEGGDQWLQAGSLSASLWIAALITVLTYAMANGMLDATTRTQSETNRLLALTAATASATCLALDVLTAHFVPIGITGPIWIAIVAVVALMLPRDVSAYLHAGGDDADPLDKDTSAA